MVGSVNVDTTLHVPHIPVVGETILSTSSATAPGGKGANQAAAAAVAGGDVGFVAAVGDDRGAHVGTANLARLGMDLAGVQEVPAARTGTATILVSPAGDNVIVVDSGANALLMPETVTAALRRERARAVLTQLETPLLVAAACGAHTAVRWRILNPSPIPPGVDLSGVMRGFTTLVPNRTELAQLAGRPVPETIDDVASCVASLGFGGDVVVTLGADGAAVFEADGDAPTVCRPPAIEVRDTTGAGDVFCGTLAAELAAHDDLARAVRAAVAASARSTRFPGAQLLAQVDSRTR